MPVVTHNIRLSPLRHTDAEAIYNCMGDKTISENTLRIPCPYTMEHARTWLAENFVFEHEHGYKKNYAIRNKAGLLMGAIGVHFNYGKDADKSEFGYWLGKPYRNKGIMTAAVKSFCELVKKEFGLNILEAHVFAGNVASQKVLVKAGFVQKESIPNYERDGINYNAVKFEKKI